jgi:hypothetical protein
VAVDFFLHRAGFDRFRSSAAGLERQWLEGLLENKT